MVTVSLCMIVRDEEMTLERCLDTASRFANEIIIVDTGSADQTRQLARRYTEHVFDFAWNDDFSAARNYSFSLASMDYCMWLDADDVITESNLKKLLKLKETLNPATDVIMMNYASGTDDRERIRFSYYRERMVKNRQGFTWEGRVHEVIVPRGTILYSDITISHQKIKPGDPDRNLRIYEKILSGGGSLNDREQFYYARELYFHRRYEEAAAIFVRVLQGDGWAENKIEACLNLAECYRMLGLHQQKLTALLHSFQLDTPRGEICCELGRHFLEAGQYETAAFWYKTALSLSPPAQKGAFVRWDCYDLLPRQNLAVCCEKLEGRKQPDEPNVDRKHMIH